MTTNNTATLGYLGYGTGTFRPFNQVFSDARHIKPKEACDVDALVIWGGEDISTSFYDEDGGIYTYADRHVTKRDKDEADAIKAAIAAGVPIIGVCRGAQLLCALAGGKLIQDVNGHNRGDHEIVTSEGRTIITSSVHHQMMWPYNGTKHKLLAWSREPQAGIYNFKQGDTRYRINQPEPEVVWFPEIKGLAVQGHPEFQDPQCEFVKYVMDLVREYVL